MRIVAPSLQQPSFVGLQLEGSEAIAFNRTDRAHDPHALAVDPRFKA